MFTTSHQRMRTRLISRQRDGEQGCIRPQRPGRSNDERRAINESTGVR